MALEQIEEDMNRNIQNTSIAVRGSNSEKFDDFLKLFDKKTGIKKVETDNHHKSNMSMLNKKL